MSREATRLITFITVALAALVGILGWQGVGTPWPGWLEEIIPIIFLILIILIVLGRLPKVDLGHSEAYTRRRFMNWFPLGMTYAFLYMGRYNLTVSKNALGELGMMTNEDFGTIFAIGTFAYGLSFIINGPLTDRWGGRATILISAAGSAVMNVVLGLVTWGRLTGQDWAGSGSLVPAFSVIYAANMYFQSFGAVSIVKVNAHWFHVRERGMIGGVFGILISLGVYFAYDWGRLIIDNLPAWWVFFIPAVLLFAFVVIDTIMIRDLPSQAGFKDFDTADASSGDDGPQLPVLKVAKMMFTNPVIIIIGLIEFCSGFLRNAIMQWYTIFARQTGAMEVEFVPRHWGMMLCVAGITGGMFAGVISDRVFHSRRGPVASILYGMMLIGSLFMIPALTTPALGWVAIFVSMCVIGVHGMLSGTASMDFGGKKNAGIAVGLIDGLVYLGVAAEAVVIGQIVPEGAAAADAANWWKWPLTLAPMALIGFLLALKIWNAKPQPKKVPAAVAQFTGDQVAAASADDRAGDAGAGAVRGDRPRGEGGP